MRVLLVILSCPVDWIFLWYVNLRVWLSWLSAGVRYRVVRCKYRRFGLSLFLVPQSRCPTIFPFYEAGVSWHRGKGELETGNVDTCWLVQSLRFDMSGGGNVCWIVSISVLCTVAIFYPVFKSSPTTGQKTFAPLFLFDASSIFLWQLLNFVCALNVWLTFGVGLFLTAQTHRGRLEILMVVDMWGCVLGCDAV